MSKQVDQRVVEMRFDNSQFERNVQTTMSTLDKLKQSLHLKGAEKGFENVDSAAKKVDMTYLGRGLEAVQAKFSALEVMGVTALANITNSAVNAGKRMVSALTIDPIKTGFDEYETKIGAIQTIMSNTASKGTTMEDVTRVIGELNTYADKTIYNFAEMTRNIGTFTAAGVGLEESASAIQGIANLAASSGSTSQQASTAMYQLSQALASGTVKLMDWNSVVNAGMGGEKFQEALKATAREHGVAVDDIIKKSGSFRDSLKEEWLSADILNETLNKFTVDGAKKYAKSMMESGKWTQEQADALIKEAQSMEDAATKVKTFTQLWDTLKEAAQSGWSQSWEIIVGDFEEAKDLFTQVSDTIGGMIGASAEARNKMLQGWKDLGGRTAVIDAIKNAFEGVMNIVKPISEAFREVFPPLTAEKLMGFSEGLRNLTERFKELSKSAAGDLKSTFKGVFSIFKLGIDIITGFAKGVMSLLKAILPVGDGLLATTGSLGDFVSGVCEAVSELNIFENIFAVLASIVSPVADAIGSAFTGLSDGINNLGGLIGILKAVANAISWLFDKIVEFTNGVTKGEGFQPLMDLVNGGLLAGVLVGIKKFMKALTDTTSEGFGFLKGIKDILGGVSDALGAFTDSIKAKTLKTIAIAIGILAAALFVLSLIDSDKMASSLGAITTLFIELFASMAVFEKIMGGSGFKSMGKVTTAMLKLSVALLILAAALKIISTLSWQQMLVGLGGIAASIGILIGAVKLLPEKDVNKAAKAIKKLSTSLLILAVALKIMGSMTWGEMAVGLTTMVGGLAALVGASHLLPKDLGGKALGMIALASAMVILSAALKIMGTMSWEEIGKSLVTLAGSLVIIAGAMYLMPSALPGAAALLVVSAALVVLSGALKIMGTMSWEGIAKGLTVLAGSLIIIAGAMYLMTGALPGAAALLVVSAALAILAPVLLALGSMSWESIAKGLVALAGAFAVIGVAGLLLTPLVPTLLGLGAAIALLGAGCALVGAGILAFSAGLAALAVSGTTGAAALVGIITSILQLIPQVATAIGEAIVALVLAITTTLAECTPQILSCLGVMLTSFLEFIVTYIPMMVNAGMQLIMGILQGIAENIGGIIDAATDIIVNFLDGIARNLPRVIDSGIKLVISFINGMADGIRNNTDAMISAVNNLMDAVMDAIKKWFSNSVSKGKELVGKLVSGVKSKFGDMKTAAKDMMEGFIKGVGEKFGAIKQKAVDAVKGAVDAVKNFLGINSPSKLFAQFGRYTDEGFIVGLQQYSKNVYNAGADIGRSVNDGICDTLGINSPAKVGIEDGKYVVQGIAEGIKKEMSAEEAAKKKAQNISDAFQTEFSKIDADVKTIDLEYKLWESMNPNATKLDKLSAELDMLNQKVKEQSKSIELAQGEYQVTVDTFGKDAEETQSAYNKLLQQKINLSDLMNRINNTQKELNEEHKNLTNADDYTEEHYNAYMNRRTAVERYNQYLKEYQESLLAAGATMDEIRALAAKNSGWDPNNPLGVATTDASNTPAGSALLTNYGSQVTTNVSTGIQNGEPQVTEAMDAVMTSCVDQLKSKQSEWKDAGGYLVTGFVNGIRDNIEAAAQAAAQMAIAAYNAAMAALQINSPSKAFAELGMYVDEGFAQGISKFANAAKGAAVDMSKETIDAVKNPLSKIADIINGDLDTTPTIRPVLDLSGIQNGANQINGMFGQRTFALAGINARISNVERMREIDIPGNSDIVNAISELRGDFGDLANAINNMQITMDGNTVVGKIINKIDNQLGQIVSHKGRGN